MGLVYSQITLTNQRDEFKYEDNELPKENIRQWKGKMLVDTGVIRLAINEDIKRALGLRNGLIINTTLADGSTKEMEMVTGITIRFKERSFHTDAFVLPGSTEPLLGAIPLEAMDLVVIPSEEKLSYNPKHPDGPVFSLK